MVLARVSTAGEERKCNEIRPPPDSSEIDGAAEIVRLKRELLRTRRALSDQVFRRRQLGAELSLTAERKDGELRTAYRTNFDGLGGVLRSLYVFESRLRKEQQLIRRQLGERDAVIREQQSEIAKLRSSLARCGRGESGDDERDDARAARPVDGGAGAVDGEDAVSSGTSKPDLITSISPRPTGSEDRAAADDGRPSPALVERRCCLPPDSRGTRNSAAAAAPSSPHVAAVHCSANQQQPNFNRNVYHSKTVTDLSLNDISSFPNPTPNNNLFVVSNSIFSKDEFAHNGASRETIASVKQNGRVITSALKKADKYPSPKTVHFGKTTHIPEPEEDGQTDIVKTVETLLLQCGDSCTESENDTSSTASTETSPSVSQMVRKFESICTTTTGAADKGSSPGSPPRRADRGGSYIAEDDLKTAAVAEPDAGSPRLEERPGDRGAAISDLDPRNNFEEFRFEDSDSDCRPDGDGLEYPGDRPAVSRAALSNSEDCAGGQANYESFLEVTGLSQKSIITVVPVVRSSPSNRVLYGSHRNVQKPKDVKSRSRVKSSSSTSFECKVFPSTAIKYWTEPYL